jgi:uncharacterized protein with HEPN domain
MKDRNIVIDMEILWNIAVKNIPELKTYCEAIIKEEAGL